MAALPRSVVRAGTFDVVAILLFVAIGRRNHHEDGSVIGGLVSVSAPFLIALASGWLVARAWRTPASVDTGVVVWIVTVAMGLVLRRFAFNDGTALPFIIVATLFTGLLLVGWRVAFERVRQHR